LDSLRSKAGQVHRTRRTLQRRRCRRRGRRNCRPRPCRSRKRSSHHCCIRCRSNMRCRVRRRPGCLCRQRPLAHRRQVRLALACLRLALARLRPRVRRCPCRRSLSCHRSLADPLQAHARPTATLAGKGGAARDSEEAQHKESARRRHWDPPWRRLQLNAQNRRLYANFARFRDCPAVSSSTTRPSSSTPVQLLAATKRGLPIRVRGVPHPPRPGKQNSAGFARQRRQREAASGKRGR
jgi:hypothetical protein